MDEVFRSGSTHHAAGQGAWPMASGARRVRVIPQECQAWATAWRGLRGARGEDGPTDGAAEDEVRERGLASQARLVEAHAVFVLIMRRGATP